MPGRIGIRYSYLECMSFLQQPCNMRTVLLPACKLACVDSGDPTNQAAYFHSLTNVCLLNRTDAGRGQQQCVLGSAAVSMQSACTLCRGYSTCAVKGSKLGRHYHPSAAVCQPLRGCQNNWYGASW